MEAVRYDYLSSKQYPAVFQTFREAFADYSIDMNYMNEVNMLNRWIKNGVDFGLSAAAFDGDRMVGFTIIGADSWKGAPAAFDAGTGIIPAYRGKGVASGMLEAVVKRLRKRQISKFLLEVLQDNAPAIRAYEKNGFRIAREFDCYALDVEKTFAVRGPLRNDLLIRPVTKRELTTFEPFIDWYPSWENSFSSIRRIPDEVLIFGAMKMEQWAGMITYYPGLNWVMNVVVNPSFRRSGVATALLHHLLVALRGKTELVKMINVDHSDAAMASWLKKTGWKRTTGQYEMILELD